MGGDTAAKAYARGSNWLPAYVAYVLDDSWPSHYSCRMPGCTPASLGTAYG